MLFRSLIKDSKGLTFNSVNTYRAAIVWKLVNERTDIPEQTDPSKEIDIALEKIREFNIQRAECTSLRVKAQSEKTAVRRYISRKNLNKLLAVLSDSSFNRMGGF